MRTKIKGELIIDTRVCSDMKQVNIYGCSTFLDPVWVQTVNSRVF